MVDRVAVVTGASRGIGKAIALQHTSKVGLAKYKWSEKICCHSGDFPRTPAGKIRKTELRARWAARREPERAHDG